MRIIGVCIVGEGEEKRYLQKTKDCFRKLCEETVYWKDGREWGKFQNLIKEDSLREVAKRNPDWVLSLDADEELTCTRKQLEALTKSDEISYRFYFAQKWNNEETMNEVFNFWDVRFFKWMPELGIKYQNTPLHCGMAPFWAYQYAWDAPFIVIHRGLMKESDRLAKTERYEKYDPKMVYCSPVYYNGLKSKEKGTLFNFEELQKKVEEAVKLNGTRKRPPIEVPKKMKQHKVLRLADNSELVIEDKYLEDTLNEGGRGKKFQYLGLAEEDVKEAMTERPREVPVKTTPQQVDALISGGAEAFWVRRSDGFVFECSKNAIYDTLSQPGMELIGEIRIAKPIPVAEVPIEADPLECLACGFLAKNKSGLRLHGKKHISK